MRIVLHDTPDGSVQWTCAHGARMWQGRARTEADAVAAAHMAAQGGLRGILRRLVRRLLRRVRRG